MRDYIKPFIEDEEIEIEDICSVSGGTRGVDVDTDIIQEDTPGTLWG